MVFALAGTQPVLYCKGMVAVLAVPIGLDRKGDIPAVIVLAVVGCPLVLDQRGMVLVVPIEGFHTVAEVEVADS